MTSAEIEGTLLQAQNCDYIENEEIDSATYDSLMAGRNASDVCATATTVNSEKYLAGLSDLSDGKKTAASATASSP